MITAEVLDNRETDSPLLISALMADLCEHSYPIDTEENRLEYCRSLGFYEVEPFENIDTDTQVLIVSNDTSIVVVFRGSESKLDWKTNFHIRKVKTSYGKIHRGWHGAIKSIAEDLLYYIDRIENMEDKKLYITGHSLGAALATLFAGLYCKSTVKGLYTFGSPRTGNKEWQSYINDNIAKPLGSNCLRWVNNGDVVCRVPLYILGYRHIDKCMYIATDGTIMEDPSVSRQTFGGMLWGSVKHIGTKGFNIIEDHYPDYYFNAFTKAMGRSERMKHTER